MTKYYILRNKDRALLADRPVEGSGPLVWVPTLTKAMGFDTVEDAEEEMWWQLQHNKEWKDDVRIIPVGDGTGD